MKLENIGFYTLSDDRAKNASVTSPMWRCELLLTDRCNFSCPYCRGLRKDCAGDMPLDFALEVLDFWIKDGLRNVRFSGGEPTLYPYLNKLVEHCKKNKVERIAVSTNGSKPLLYYKQLITSGVNDFSISLDGCCASLGDKMVGGISGAWEKIVSNIREISKLSYTTVGMVFTEENLNRCEESVLFAHSLGVDDIRVIPSAQYNKALKALERIPSQVIESLPILKYRVQNIKNGRHVRGITNKDSYKCWLAVDDMVVAGKWHFPCIIHLREGGNPIGKVSANMRQERANWINAHTPQDDCICKENCLDVCVDYNNKVNCNLYQHYIYSIYIYNYSR